MKSSSAGKIKFTSYDDLFVGDLKDEPKKEAIIISPINHLPSEKARNYRLKIEKMSHQGIKGDKSTADLVGEEAGDSGRTVQRYIRLTNLIRELLEFVDQRKISLEAGERISFLSEEEQGWILKAIDETGILPSGIQAGVLKEESKQKHLTITRVYEILGKEVYLSGLNISAKKIKGYFPQNFSKSQMEAVIFKLLDLWKEQGSGV